MKRSQINQIILEAKAFLEERKFHLPPFAHWSPAQWKDPKIDHRHIIREQLGWDITDFGQVMSAFSGVDDRHEGEKVDLTLSVGVAVFPTDAKDKDALICRVDEALYNARSRGPNHSFAFATKDDSTAGGTKDDRDMRELDQLLLSREGRVILSMVTRVVNHELDLENVLSLVTGSVVEATRGERGFFMLKGRDGELRCGQLRYEPASNAFYNNEVPLDLSPREGDLLKRLMSRVDHVVPKEELRIAVFGDNDGFHAAIVPSSVAHMNRAGPDAVPSLTTKPLPLYETMPVGPPRTWTTSGERTPVAL